MRGKGQTIFELTGFERDILFTLAGLPNMPKGNKIKSHLEAYYPGYDDISTGRFYPALNRLAEYGFVEKRQSRHDGRANSYGLTQWGQDQVQLYARIVAQEVGIADGE